jgi:diguanylate cyclase (GGDEF)-like protein
LSSYHSYISLSEHEIVRIKRTNEKLSLMIIDIDNFKQINDQLGHEGGDKVLVEFSKLINNFLRDIDIFARWGGEEFCILLPNTNKKQAIQIVERLIKKVQKANYRIKMMDTVGTISIGVAEYNSDLDIQALISHADNALYQAKEKGRNCYVSIN